MKRLCFLLLISTSVIFSQTDQLEIDSLIKRARNHNTKTIDSALYYSKKAFSLAKKKKDTFLIGATGYYYSYYLITSNNFESATKILSFNIENSEKLPTVLLGNTYQNLASISYLKENYDKAIEDYLTAQDYYYISNNKQGLARSQLQLSVIYSKLGNVEMENYFADLALESSQNKTHASNKLALEEKILILKNQLSGNNDLSKKQEAMLHHSLGIAYFNANEMSKAISSFKRSVAIKKSIGFNNLITRAQLYIAKAYINNNEFQKALTLVNSIEVNEKRKQPLEVQYILTEAYKGTGDYEKALIHNQKLAKLQDSINKIDEGVKIAEITSKYNTQEKEKQIVALQAKNKKKWWLLVLITLVFVAAFFWFVKKWQTLKKKNAIVNEEKDEIQQKFEAQHLLLKSKSKIYFDELYFIKSEGNYVEFHSVAKKMLEREKLKEVLEKLPPNFVRVHRSYIVNKNQIASFNSHTIFLKSGFEIPLSRTYKNNLK